MLKTTAYGGIFIPRNSDTSAGQEKSPVFAAGDSCFYIRGWQPEISRQVIIGHGDSPEVAEELRTLVAARFPEAEIFIAPIGPVIGAHAGPGVMTVFFWGNNR